MQLLHFYFHFFLGIPANLSSLLSSCWKGEVQTLVVVDQIWYGSWCIAVGCSNLSHVCHCKRSLKWKKIHFLLLWYVGCYFSVLDIILYKKFAFAGSLRFHEFHMYTTTQIKVGNLWTHRSWGSINFFSEWYHKHDRYCFQHLLSPIKCTENS